MSLFKWRKDYEAKKEFLEKSILTPEKKAAWKRAIKDRKSPYYNESVDVLKRDVNRVISTNLQARELVHIGRLTKLNRGGKFRKTKRNRNRNRTRTRKNKRR